MLTRSCKNALLIILSALLVVSCSAARPQPGHAVTDGSLPGAGQLSDDSSVQAPPASQLVAVEVVARIDSSLLPGEPELPLQSKDLLGRLSRSLVLHDSDHSQVDAQLKWFAARPDYMDRVFARSSRYLWFIMDEIDKRNMPPDIALLPIV
jgi:membrane-bound lytic murein transglycosylase D